MKLKEMKIKDALKFCRDHKKNNCRNCPLKINFSVCPLGVFTEEFRIPEIDLLNIDTNGTKKLITAKQLQLLGKYGYSAKKVVNLTRKEASDLIVKERNKSEEWRS